MPPAIPDVLARIVEHKKSEREAKISWSRSWERAAADRTGEKRGFRAALEARAPAVIAEIKKASPSKGLLAADFRPAWQAGEYERGGAAALSVLTDARFFQGSLDDLESAREAVRLPVLRKDFTLDELDILEAAAHGADAILLIAAILSEGEMRRLRERAAEYGLAALVEVHNEDELDAAAASGAQILGVNNRNLHTFEVSLETAERLAERMPAGALRVAESGIDSRAGLERLRAAGYQAFLIGEHLMKAGDPAAALRELLG